MIRIRRTDAIVSQASPPQASYEIDLLDSSGCILWHVETQRPGWAIDPYVGWDEAAPLWMAADSVWEDGSQAWVEYPPSNVTGKSWERIEEHLVEVWQREGAPKDPVMRRGPFIAGPSGT